MFNNKFTKDSVSDAVERILDESPEQIDELSKKTLANYMRANTKRMADPKNPDSMERKMKRHDDYFTASKKFHKENLSFKDQLIENMKKKQYEEELFPEEKMSDAQTKKKEEIVLSMKDKEKEFKAKYGKNWKNVMYATATKLAMKEEVIEEKWDDEDDDVAKADRELARMKAKPIPAAKINTDKDKIKKTKKDKEEEMDESAGPYELYNPKHPKFKTNYDKFKSKNPEKGIKDFVSHMKAKEMKNEEVEIGESKDPVRDGGCGSEQPFVQNANTTSNPVTPLSKVKDIVKSAHKRIKNEMLGKIGTSEEVDVKFKDMEHEISDKHRSHDTLAGRVKGGKHNQHNSFKIKLKSGNHLTDEDSQEGRP